MVKFRLIILFYIAAGCGSPAQKVNDEYKNYKFDQQVIDKLPVYDSLAGNILSNFQVFHNLINDKDSYRSYRYFPSSSDADVSKKLPVGTEMISKYYDQLGKNFIYGFDVFKDSTIRIYIRNNYSGTLQADIRENLSYYPPGSTIRRREFPVKDTILNKNWQYWISFDEQEIF